MHSINQLNNFNVIVYYSQLLLVSDSQYPKSQAFSQTMDIALQTNRCSGVANTHFQP